MNALPLLQADLALGHALRESRLNGFDDVAQFFGNQSKQEDDAILPSVSQFALSLGE